MRRTLAEVEAPIFRGGPGLLIAPGLIVGLGPICCKHPSCCLEVGARLVETGGGGRDLDAIQETWLVHLIDVHVGTIMRSVGNPTNAVPQWQWRCGFYPGSTPGECMLILAGERWRAMMWPFGQARQCHDGLRSSAMFFGW